VDDGPGLEPLVDAGVHRDLAGGLHPSVDLLAVEIEYGHVIDPELIVRHAGRCRGEAITVPDAEVAGPCRGHVREFGCVSYDQFL